MVEVAGTIFEGVSDQIIYTFCTIICLGTGGMYIAYSRSSSNATLQEIHEDSQGTVHDIRQRLQDQYRQAHTGHGDSPRRDGELRCPVCLNDAVYAIETNCGHTFCGTCIVTYWRHGRWFGAVRCPVCRQQVIILLFCFTEEERQITSPEKQSLLNDIHDYNRRFSGEPRPLLDYLRDLPTLLRHTASEFFSVGGLIWMFRLRIILCFVAALIYFLSPLDILPEAVFGILGFIDDFFILLLLAIYVSIIYRRFIESREP